MANRREYIFTNHLRERFYQRTHNKKYIHLQYCHKKECETCRVLLVEVRAKVAEKRRELGQELSRRVNAAVESRSYLNNSGFMQWYYDKYGFDKRFEFLVSDDILFVVVVDEGRKVIVTCVSTKTHLAGKVTLRPKFNKIKKLEEKLGIS